MEKKPKPLRLNFTVRPGSPLDKFVRSLGEQSASSAIHELAAINEVLKSK